MVKSKVAKEDKGIDKATAQQTNKNSYVDECLLRVLPKT